MIDAVIAAIGCRMTVRNVTFAETNNDPVALGLKTTLAAAAPVPTAEPKGAGRMDAAAASANAHPCAMYFPVGDWVPLTDHALPVVATFWLSYIFPVFRSSV